jgi:thiamine biosynthesis protein ThiS
MRLIINGEEKDFASISTLASLVENLGLKPDRLAIERNREIVPRGEWSNVQLQENDRLEIVHFVGGGNLCADAASASLRFVRLNVCGCQGGYTLLS